MAFTGSPKYLFTWVLQLIFNPTFEALNFSFFTLVNHLSHPASDPRRRQLAPPMANKIAFAEISSLPFSVSKSSDILFNDMAFILCLLVTPLVSNRESQALNKGDAFICVGKTRPVLPVKRLMPNEVAQV